ncbi:hypothetical protein D9613_001795 [Agrocybe pediades]|uniref:Rad21/Rec8-like protein N-terminal domain-containing protein n=1 Tax=Agrocybe pediades TaxID=84607 RepID=A0A8H4R7U1_9AGAR|nr:hypothetical protein D9613_001795 [Agrocybe pediades]
MFFTTELLGKRDSGFGLLWLAATLGSRSNFKKLPKRSVLTADITQLCDLISEPDEPLALRLSSNLMFGVVRVIINAYLWGVCVMTEGPFSLVKQDIFMSDVTNCVATLKKVVQDMRASGSAQLQMANPSVRPAAVTLIADPNQAYALDFDAFVVNWDEYLNIEGNNSTIIEETDDDFDPNAKSKGKPKAGKKALPPATETMRKEQHTLDEHHEHLLSASFDLSFNANVPGQGPSSSQMDDAPFDNFFPFTDGLDIGEGLGDDLARELGNVDEEPEINFDQQLNDFNMDMDFELNVPELQLPNHDGLNREASVARSVPVAQTPRKENDRPASRIGSAVPDIPIGSPATSFSRLLLTQDEEMGQPLRDVTAEALNMPNPGEPRPRKAKRTRLLLDARTELTDDELKIARAKYMESQRCLRKEVLMKRLEKEAGQYVENFIWGAPKGIQEPGLREFWKENFKVQVEMRSGALRIHYDGDEHPAKKRKTSRLRSNDNAEERMQEDQPYADGDWAMEWGAGNDGDMAMMVDDPNPNRHSSEEPGQARRLSRSASVFGANLGFDIGTGGSGNGSQRSSLFPWDNAGGRASSSSGNVPFAQIDSEQHPVEYVDVRLRSSSISRHGSPMVHNSQRGSVQGAGISFSPAQGGRGSQAFGEDFQFEIDNQEQGTIPEETQQETQKSELNLVTLERNSYNFLEYVKMQCQALSKPEDGLTFEIVVPKTTSTRHVAAAGFYHCLVLATKKLIRLQQPDAYEAIRIAVV